MAVWGERTREQDKQDRRDVEERVVKRECVEDERRRAVDDQERDENGYTAKQREYIERLRMVGAASEEDLTEPGVRCIEVWCVGGKGYHTRDEMADCYEYDGRTREAGHAAWDRACARVDRAVQESAIENGRYRKQRLALVASGVKDAHKNALPPKKQRQVTLNTDPSVPEWAGGVIREAEQEMDDHVAGRMGYENAIRSDAYKGKESMYGHTLPGHGSSRESCGCGFTRGCLGGVNHPEGKGEMMVVVNGCNQSECNKCFPKWIRMTAAGAVNRLSAFHKLYQSDPSISPGRLVKSGYVPFVVSWHPNMVARMRDPVVYMEQMERATSMINQSGFRGVVLVEHPMRFKKKPYDPYYSCHVHGVGLGRTDREKILQLHRYGRLVDPMSEGEPRPIPVEERIVIHVFNAKVTHSAGYIYNHIAYLLSHVGLRQVPGKDRNAPAVRYAGDLSTRKAHVIKTESNHAWSRSKLARDLEPIIGTRRSIRKINKMVDENDVPFFPPRVAWRLKRVLAQSVASPGIMEENLDSGYGYGRLGKDGGAPERLPQGSSLVATMGAAEMRIAVWHGNLWTRVGFEGLIDNNAPKANSMRQGDGMGGDVAVALGDDPTQGVDDPSLGEYEEHNTIVCKVVHEMDVEDAAVLMGDWHALDLCTRMIRDQKAVDAAWVRYRAEALAGGDADMMGYQAYCIYYERYPSQKFRRPRKPIWMGVLKRLMALSWINERSVVIDVDPSKKGLCTWCHDHYVMIKHESGTFPAECVDECGVEQDIDATQWLKWDPRHEGDPRLPYLAVVEVNQSTEPGVRKTVLCVFRPKAGHGAPVLYDEGIDVKPNDLSKYTESMRGRIVHMYRMSVARWAASYYSRVHRDKMPGDVLHENDWGAMREWRRKCRRARSARRQRVQDVAYRYFVSTGAVDGTWDVADVLHTVDAEVERLGLGKLQ